MEDKDVLLFEVRGVQKSTLGWAEWIAWIGGVDAG